MELSPYLPLLLGDLSQHSIKDAWAKGLKSMWHSPLVRRLARHVYCLDALATQEINAYFEKPLYVDIFDEQQWEALMTTDDLDVFRKFSELGFGALVLTRQQGHDLFLTLALFLCLVSVAALPLAMALEAVVVFRPPQHPQHP